MNFMYANNDVLCCLVVILPKQLVYKTLGYSLMSRALFFFILAGENQFLLTIKNFYLKIALRQFFLITE